MNRAVAGAHHHARGETVLIEAAALKLDGTRVVVPGPTVTELVEPTASGVEQRWSFERRPAGAGAVDVELPVLAGRFVGEDANGLHFAVGSEFVRYGHGTWVDASGQRTPVPARFVAGAIRLEVPDKLLEGSTYPAVLDPVIGPETQVDLPVLAPAFGDQTEVAMARSPATILAVWQDDRNLGSAQSRIYGARLSPAGAVLDPVGFVISLSSVTASSPAVSWDGTNFLVVRSGQGLTAARVSPAGVVLDPSGIPIVTTSASRVAASWNGTHHLVAWTDRRTTASSDLYGARLTPGGTVVDSGGFPIAATALNELNPGVAWNGSNWLVTWQSAAAGGASDVQASLVAPSGSVGPVIPITTAMGDQSFPRVASFSESFLVVWTDARNGANDVYGARVNAAGAVTDPLGLAISTAVNAQSRADVAFDGTSFLVTWIDTRNSASAIGEVFGARVATAGTVLDPLGVRLYGRYDSRVPTVVSTGTGFLIAFSDFTVRFSPTDSDIVGVQVSGAGTVADAGFVISTAHADERNAAMAFDGTNYLVAWEDSRDVLTGPDIYAARISPAGVMLDPSAIRVSTSARAQVHQSVAFDGTNYFVVWEDYRNGAGAVGKSTGRGSLQRARCWTQRD